MRPIQKQCGGGYHLSQAHAIPPETAAQATSRWGSFNYKPQLLELLLNEQFGLCCYSELRADQEGLGYHIEHVENKSQNPARTFDYRNLSASAIHSDNLGKLSPGGAFGGHSPGKQGDCDMSQFVSCHQGDCHRFFVYLSDGRVVPSAHLSAVEENRAHYTINLLNLNSPFLTNRRRRWWDELDELFQEHQNENWSLDDLASIDILPTNGKLSRFFSLTRQFFGQVAERVLHEQAPDLV